MKKLHLPLIVSLFCLAACQQKPCNEMVHEKELKELQIKLNATEAQLLNVRSELAKLKGDSITQETNDSL
ncbi:MAG: hypothetical protein RIC95_09845 [Vicingaceae bacterium]